MAVLRSCFDIFRAERWLMVVRKAVKYIAKSGVLHCERSSFAER